MRVSTVLLTTPILPAFKGLKCSVFRRFRALQSRNIYGTIYVNKENGKLESNKRMWLYEKIHISILGNRVSVTYSKEV